MNRLYLRGIGMMVGMIFGAGIFALPFSFYRAGLFWGMVHFAVAFSILLLLHFLYSEVAYFTRGKHRLTGYVEIFLGNKAKQLAFFTTIASYYATLLVYGLLGGLFLSNFFNGSYKIEASIFFFVVAGLLAFLNLSKIADINFYLTVPLFGFVVYLFFIALPDIETSNFLLNLSFDFKGDWFLPYGIWLFALAGFATLPEVRDIFSTASIKDFKKVILLSLVLTAAIYFLFVFAVWGVSGGNTSPDALLGIAKIVGQNALLIGSLIGLLAVFTSFLALATDMKNIFRYDYKMPKMLAGLLTVIPPAGLFFLGAVDFVRILGLIGVLGFGVLGIFIILMSRSLRKKIKEGGWENILKPTHGYRLGAARFIEVLILAGILAGALYELWRIFW